MPTVPIDVSEYKKLHDRMIDVYVAVNGSEDEFFADFNLPLPNYICDRCGYTDTSEAVTEFLVGDICPRCDQIACIAPR